MMMDLHCCEASEHEITASVDETLLSERVLHNMLNTEDRYMSRYQYISGVQTEIRDSMILIVSEWMMEVCEEQKCQDDVFLLAMNYLYRFLSTTAIRKNQLQLLGAACMLLGSKLREPSPMSAETLVFYTDHSITKDMLTKWELLVLSKLGWDIVAIVPVDFLPHMLHRLDLERLDIRHDMVKSHAKILITLCAKETRFALYHPSQIACASIVSALCGLGWASKYHQSQQGLLQRLADIIQGEAIFMEEIVSQIDNMVRENFEDVNKAQKDTTREDQVNRPDQCTPPPGKFYEHTHTATTPTDVHDVNF